MLIIILCYAVSNHIEDFNDCTSTINSNVIKWWMKHLAITSDVKQITMGFWRRSNSQKDPSKIWSKLTFYQSVKYSNKRQWNLKRTFKMPDESIKIHKRISNQTATDQQKWLVINWLWLSQLPKFFPVADYNRPLSQSSRYVTSTLYPFPEITCLGNGFSNLL